MCLKVGMCVLLRTLRSRYRCINIKCHNKWTKLEKLTKVLENIDNSAVKAACNRLFCVSANCVSIFPLGLTFAGPARPIDGRIPNPSHKVADSRPERSKIQVLSHKYKCRPY